MLQRQSFHHRRSAAPFRSSCRSKSLSRHSAFGKFLPPLTLQDWSFVERSRSTTACRRGGRRKPPPPSASAQWSHKWVRHGFQSMTAHPEPSADASGQEANGNKNPALLRQQLLMCLNMARASCKWSGQCFDELCCQVARRDAYALRHGPIHEARDVDPLPALHGAVAQCGNFF